MVKTAEHVSTVWMENRVTTACKFGLTPIYNEFNRSRPEANNVLLGIFEERVSPLEWKGKSLWQSRLPDLLSRLYERRPSVESPAIAARGRCGRFARYAV